MAENKNPENIKIQLRAGDSPAQILKLIRNEDFKEYCFLLNREATYITEITFLKRIRQTALEKQKTIHFVTEKPFFEQVLTRQKFNVTKNIPKKYIPLEQKNIREISGKIEAKKNKPVEKKIIFKPALSPKSNTPTPTAPTPKFQANKIENTSEERSLRSLIFFGFICILGLLGFIFTLVSPQAEISVKPRISSAETTQNIIISLTGGNIPIHNESLPLVQAALIETEVQATEAFPATRETYDVTSARGKVTLYNETNQPKTIIPSRLMDNTGVILRTQENHTIPPKTESGSGQLIVDVVADDYDEEKKPIGLRGNLEAGTELYFPGFRDSLRESYYAIANQGPLVGGSTLTNYFVAPEDPERARPILEESLKIRGTESLKKELENRSLREGKEFVLLEDSRVFITEMTDFRFNEEQIGKEQQTFDASGVMRISGLVFDQAQVIEHLKAQLQTNLDQRKKILSVDPRTIVYRVVNAGKLEENGWIKVSASITGVETLDFEARNEFAAKWQKEIKRDIAGKDKRQARAILLNRPEIENVLGINISPFWVKQIPLLFDQIELDINY